MINAVFESWFTKEKLNQCGTFFCSWNYYSTVLCL